MATTVAITNRVNDLLEQRWKAFNQDVGRISKEGFVNSLLLLALIDEDFSRKAAYLCLHYFEGKGVTALEHKERA